MNRLTPTDWELIRHYLAPFRHFNGVAELLEKVETHIADADSGYIKVVRIEFVVGAGESEERVSDGEWLERLAQEDCHVVARRPPRYTLQVSDAPEAFDATIDLLENLHRSKRIRYIR